MSRIADHGVPSPKWYIYNSTPASQGSGNIKEEWLETLQEPDICCGTVTSHHKTEARFINLNNMATWTIPVIPVALQAKLQAIQND